MSPITSWVRSGCAVVLVTACTAARPGPSPDPSPDVALRPLAWSRAVLPAGAAPSLLAAGPAGSLLVAQDGDPSGEPTPRLYRLTTERVRDVPVRVTSYYGRRAVWGGLAAAGRRVYAFGGRSGGAHGNTRWTVWSGSWSGSGSGLAEEAQTFETFGGPKAGGLSAIAVPRGGGPVLVGSHVSAQGSGLDIAVWDHVGRTWVRRDSSGTALTADDDGQPAAHGMVPQGRGLLVVGSLTDVSGPKPRTVPAAWTSPGPRGPWTRHLLPAAGAPVAEAYAAACDRRGSCLIVGTDGGRLAGWRISAAGRVTSAQLPRLEVDPAHVLAACPGAGGCAVAVTTTAYGAPSRVLLGRGDHWIEAVGPPGVVTGWAAADGALWAVTTGPSGHALWSAPIP
jgi:hypothetical protein